VGTSTLSARISSNCCISLSMMMVALDLYLCVLRGKISSLSSPLPTRAFIHHTYLVHRHSSGTYDAETDTGGSNGAGMRYEAEGGDPANAGLQHARVFLEPVKEKHPWITYADLWTLAGVVAIEEMGGPSTVSCHLEADFQTVRKDRTI
jgi:hypothetical protein